MKDPSDLHVDNLREALRQCDSSLKLAILAALTLFVIDATNRGTTAEQLPANVLLGTLPVSYGTMALLAMGGQFVFALLAAGSLDAVSRALRHLKSDQRLLAAACAYPSFATSPSNTIQRGSLLLSPVLVFAAFGAELLRSGTKLSTFTVFGFLFVVSPYIWMFFQVSHLPDADHDQSAH